jgi:hypothetical protein
MSSCVFPRSPIYAEQFVAEYDTPEYRPSVRKLTYYQERPVVIMEVKKAVRSIPEGTHARHRLNTLPCA